MNVAEQKLDAFKENAERRTDILKEYVTQTKEMLEARSDQITSFEERFVHLSNEIGKIKGMMSQFQKKLITEVKVNESTITSVKIDLERHVEEYKSQMI